MAKELPYFKFEPAEYLTKDISFCSLPAQGLFVNICCYYWQRGCQLTKEQLLRRLNYETELNELISEGVIDLDDGDIRVKFLDCQLTDVEHKSKTNSTNGSKGGRPRKNPTESEIKPNENPTESETKAIREDKIREEEIRKEKRNSDFDVFWSSYGKKLELEKCKAKFLKLKDSDVELILESVDKYVKSTPDKQYRKNPLTWLNGKCWTDEIEEHKVNIPKTNWISPA